MHRIDGAGNISGQFTDGDPTTETPATVITAAWCNDIQENLLHVVEEAGIEPEKGRAEDLLDALDARYIGNRSLTGSPVEADFAASTSEVDLVRFTVPANDLGTGRKIRVKIMCTSSTPGSPAGATVRLKYGGTTLVTRAYTPAGGNTDSAFVVEAELAANGSAGAQFGTLALDYRDVSQPVYTITQFDAGASTEDSTLAKDFAVTIQRSSAVAGNVIKRKFWQAERVR